MTKFSFQFESPGGFSFDQIDAGVTDQVILLQWLLPSKFSNSKFIVYHISDSNRLLCSVPLLVQLLENKAMDPLNIARFGILENTAFNYNMLTITNNMSLAVPGTGWGNVVRHICRIKFHFVVCS